MNHLLVDKLTKDYKNVRALDDVSFEMKDGIYGLIGPNGAGKSTLIHIISTLLKADNGFVAFNDENIFRWKRAFRELLGLMPQNQKGYDDFTAYAFLYYMATLKGLDKQEAKSQIDALVKQVSLQDAIHQKIKTYSGGMRQRLMFAQALLGNPKIVILDEPTAGLDPHERIRLRNYISEIASGRIVIVATHVMQDIESIADEVLLLKKGKLVYKGSSEDLLKELDSHVYEIRATKEELQELQKNYKVSRVSKYQDDYLVRYLDMTQNIGTLHASMEDAYLYYMVDHETAVL